MRDPATQVCPAPPVNTAAVLMPAAAASRSASANTMLADLPPSSKCRGRMRSAPRALITRAVPVEPVNVSRPMPGWRTSASPASSPRPATTLTTPGGIPARATCAAHASTEQAACSAAFTTTVFPAANAAPTFADMSDSGAFHGMMTPTTPYGSRRVKLKLAEPTCTVSPWILSAAPAK